MKQINKHGYLTDDFILNDGSKILHGQLIKIVAYNEITEEYLVSNGTQEIYIHEDFVSFAL